MPQGGLPPADVGQGEVEELTVLDVDFTVEAPAGYAEYLASVAVRFERAAASSATVSRADPQP